MNDKAKLIKQAGELLTRLERLLPGEDCANRLSASTGSLRKRTEKAQRAVRHVHRISLKDLQE